jgi:hypothetical protein
MGVIDPVLGDYRARARAGRDRFVAAHPYLFIVRTAPEELAAPPAANEFEFSTRIADFEPDDDDDMIEPGWVIAPLKKREGGPFPDRIGVGRARNCDIVLRFDSVSKLHAQFRTGAALHLVDVGSVNGTSVNGQALVARLPHPVSTGDRLQFGSVAVELVDAARLFELVSG